MPRKQLQRDPLPILARRLKYNQAFGRRNGPLAVAIPVGVSAQHREDVPRRRRKPVGLLALPSIELLDSQNDIG